METLEGGRARDRGGALRRRVEKPESEQNETMALPPKQNNNQYVVSMVYYYTLSLSNTQRF